MATVNSAEMQNFYNLPATVPNVADFGGRVRCQFATVTLASQAADDIIRLARMPKGARLVDIVTTATATLGASATIALGVAGATARYRAAATHTTTTPTKVTVPAAASASNVEGFGKAFTAETDIIATVGVAALPASGTWIVQIFYTAD